MANRERGEVTLAAHNQTYTLRLTTNACCELEDRLARAGEVVHERRLLHATKDGPSTTIPVTRPRLLDDVVAGVFRGSVRDLRWLLWAALQDKHSDTVPTPERAGDLIDSAGGVAGVTTQMMAFMTMNAEPAEETRGTPGGTSADPQTAEGVGVGSTSTLVVSA